MVRPTKQNIGDLLDRGPQHRPNPASNLALPHTWRYRGTAPSPGPSSNVCRMRSTSVGNSVAKSGAASDSKSYNRRKRRTKSGGQHDGAETGHKKDDIYSKTHIPECINLLPCTKVAFSHVAAGVEEVQGTAPETPFGTRTGSPVHQRRFAPHDFEGKKSEAVYTRLRSSRALECSCSQQNSPASFFVQTSVRDRRVVAMIVLTSIRATQLPSTFGSIAPGEITSTAQHTVVFRNMQQAKPCA